MHKIPILTGATLTGAALALVVATSTVAASPAGPWTGTVTLGNGASATATVAKAANGTGTITVKLKGLRADRLWIVDVDGGKTAAGPATAEIAFRSAYGVETVSSRTLTIHLTRARMEAFLDTAASSGIVLRFRDGADRSAALLA